MTRPTVMHKDRLAAFVDGELSPEEAAAVVMHLADHPEDQAYVDDLMAANAALAQAFARPMEEPVPPALRALISGEAAPAAVVVPFRSQPRRSAPAVWGGLVAGAALAAGLVLAVYLPTGAGPDLAPGPLAADSRLQPALASLPTGEVQTLPDGSEVMILATLPTPGGFCREIEVVRPAVQSLQAALVCTEGRGWEVEVVIAENLASAATAEGFATASGDEAQSFALFLDRLGAGATLSPQEEAAAMARGWAK